MPSLHHISSLSLLHITPDLGLNWRLSSSCRHAAAAADEKFKISSWRGSGDDWVFGGQEDRRGWWSLNVIEWWDEGGRHLSGSSAQLSRAHNVSLGHTGSCSTHLSSRETETTRINSIYIFTAQPRKTETQNWKILQFHSLVTAAANLYLHCNACWRLASQ